MPNPSKAFQNSDALTDLIYSQSTLSVWVILRFRMRRVSQFRLRCRGVDEASVFLGGGGSLQPNT